MFKMNKKGFTLVELMVVLAILGLLAGIGIPQYMKTLENSRIATDKANIGRVQSAVDAFLAETNFWTIGTGGITASEALGAPDTVPTVGATATSILTGGAAPLSNYWSGKLPKFNSKNAKAAGNLWYMDKYGRVYIGAADGTAIVLE